MDDKFYLPIILVIIILFVVFIIWVAYARAPLEIENCIENGGKALVSRTGLFKGCIYG